MDIVGKQLMKAQAKSIQSDLFGDDDKKRGDPVKSKQRLAKEKEQQDKEAAARAERQAARRSAWLLVSPRYFCL